MNAPIIRPEDVEAAIADEQYFTAAQGVSGARHVIHDENTTGPLARITICVLTLKNGFSTPDAAEAMVKGQAMKQCKTAWVLADSSKFDVICPVTFGRFRDARVITAELAAAEYRKEENIMEADKQ